MLCLHSDDFCFSSLQENQPQVGDCLQGTLPWRWGHCVWVLQEHTSHTGLCHAGKQPPVCASLWDVFAVTLPK